MIWVGRHSAWTMPILVSVLLVSWGVYAIGNPTVSELQQLLNPVFLAGLLTYHWHREKALCITSEGGPAPQCIA